jgi:hypothetical protein
MVGKLTVLLLAFGAASTATWALLPATPQTVRAGGSDCLADTDDDFLPDLVEWGVLTSATNPDTDGDGVGDFVEVVQKGAPRCEGEPLALDHEMRLVLTAPPVGSPDQTSWIHLFIRFAAASTPVTSFHVWFETPWAPGLRVPLESLFAGASMEERITTNQGVWLRASVPLVDASLLQQLLPCGVYAEATIGGQLRQTGVTLLDVQGTIATIVPYGRRRENQFAFQSIAPPACSGPGTNKVCVLDMAEVGSGPGGTVFEITAAECTDSNELECGAGCAQSVGWILTIPGGLAALGAE